MLKSILFIGHYILKESNHMNEWAELFVVREITKLLFE